MEGDDEMPSCLVSDFPPSPNFKNQLLAIQKLTDKAKKDNNCHQSHSGSKGKSRFFCDVLRFI